MPIFEYKCDKCDTTKELIKSYTKREEPSDCDKCDGTLQFINKIQRTSFQLKGGGWYDSGGY